MEEKHSQTDGLTDIEKKTNTVTYKHADNESGSKRRVKNKIRLIQGPVRKLQSTRKR